MLLLVGIWIVVWDVVPAWLADDDDDDEEVVGCTLVDDVVELGAGIGAISDVGSTEEAVSDSAGVGIAGVLVSDAAVDGAKAVVVWTTVVSAGAAVLGWTSEEVSLCTCSVDGDTSVDVGMAEGGGVTGVSLTEVGVVEVTTTAVANIFSAAAWPSAMSSSETGFSSSLHPVCMGVRRSESTLERPSEHDKSMHDSTSSSRPSLEATHMSF